MTGHLICQWLEGGRGQLLTKTDKGGKVVITVLTNADGGVWVENAKISP